MDYFTINVICTAPHCCPAKFKNFSFQNSDISPKQTLKTFLPAAIFGQKGTWSLLKIDDKILLRYRNICTNCITHQLSPPNNQLLNIREQKTKLWAIIRALQ